MTNIIKGFLTVLLVVVATLTYSQEKTVIEVGGKKYYVHHVQQGETLGTISREYGVSEKDIAQENPNVMVGLKPGQALKIPVYTDETSDNIEVANTQQEPENVQVIEHEVQRKQTLYFISKLYSVELEDIYAYNPELRSQGLREGDVIKIPVKDTKFDIGTYHKYDSDFIMHRVEGGQTLYAISKQYNVTVDELMKANPELYDGLKAGQVIKIPNRNNGEPEYVTTHKEVSPNEFNFDLSEAFYMNSPTIPCDKFNYDIFRPTFKIAVFLPLCIDENKKLEFAASSPEDAGFYRNTDKFIEFYEGVLVAVQKLKEQGVSTEVFLFDTKRDADYVESILHYSELPNMDLIIGPIYPQNLKIVSDFARDREINIVSPLASSLAMVSDNPFLFQVRPAAKTQVEQSCRFLYNVSGKNIVFVHNGTKEEIDLVDEYELHLSSNHDEFDPYSDVQMTTVDYNIYGIDAVTEALSEEMENIVVLVSTEEIFVIDMVARLTVLQTEYKLSLWGESSWQKFKELDVESLKNLGMHYINTENIDYKGEREINFIRLYRELYATEPTPYSFQGFDVTYFFMSAMKQHGKYFQFCMESPYLKSLQQGLQLRFDFERLNYLSGFENKGVYLLKYDDDLNVVPVSFDDFIREQSTRLMETEDGQN